MSCTVQIDGQTDAINSGYCCGIVEAFTIVGCFTTVGGGWLLTCDDGLSFPSPKDKQSKKLLRLLDS